MLAPTLENARPLEIAANDYETVRRAVEFVNRRFRDQPEVEEIARAAGVAPRALTDLFRRWCGLSPKAFLQAVTLDAARQVLSESHNVLEAAYELGFSGPGRLHDLFVVHESLSPGEWKTGAAGLIIRWGFHPSPFGRALAMATPRGLCGLAFADEGGEDEALADMRRRWPNAIYVEDPLATAPYAARIFDQECWRPDDPLRIVFIGTDFEVRVWETLMRIPMGRATTYSAIAGHIDRPKAARAIGAAVGKNPNLFVVHESLSPGEWKTGAAGLIIRWGFHPSPFGRALAMATPRGLCGLAFADEGGEDEALADMRRRWPNAIYVEDPLATAPYAARIFDQECWRPDDPLRIVFIGTDFEVRVWETLMRIPMGRATTYSAIAGHIDRPKAARAIGAAVGKNPMSFVVPCHRVLGKSGDLTGYHWGLTRKRAILGWEAGQVGGK